MLGRAFQYLRVRPRLPHRRAPAPLRPPLSQHETSRGSFQRREKEEIRNWKVYPELRLAWSPREIYIELVLSPFGESSHESKEFRDVFFFFFSRPYKVRPISRATKNLPFGNSRQHPLDGFYRSKLGQPVWKRTLVSLSRPKVFEVVKACAAGRQSTRWWYDTVRIIIHKEKEVDDPVLQS